MTMTGVKLQTHHYSGPERFDGHAEALLKSLVEKQAQVLNHEGLQQHRGLQTYEDFIQKKLGTKPVKATSSADPEQYVAAKVVAQCSTDAALENTDEDGSVVVFTKSIKSSSISKGSQTRLLRRRKVASFEVLLRSLVTRGCVASPLCRWLHPWPLRPRSARTQTASLGSSRIYKVFRIFQDLKQPPEGFTKSLKSSRISKGSQTRVELRRRKVASLEVSQRSLVTGGCVASPLGCNRGICGRGPLARRPRHLAPLEFAKSLESSRISNDLHKASPNHLSLQGFQRVPTPESSCVKEMSLRLRSRSGAW